MDSANDLVSLLKKGTDCATRGEAAAAQAAFETALALDPKCHTAHCNLGALFWQAGKIEQAGPHFAAAYQANPLDAATVINFSIWAGTTNNFDLAKSACRQYLQQHPANIEMWRFYTALVEDISGKFAAEIQRLQKKEQVSRYQNRELERGLRDLFEILKSTTKVFLQRTFKGRALGNYTATMDLILRRRQLHGRDPNVTQVIVSEENPYNRQILDMFKRHLPIIENDALYHLLLESQVLKDTEFLGPMLDNQTNEFLEYNRARATLSFTPEEEQRGRDELVKMGIPPDAWFVALFVRDAAYKKFVFPDQDYERGNNFRDADIAACHKAIEFLVNQGGYVVRMGFQVAKPLGYQHPHAIDYASKFRSDFMDIYLMAKCRFAIGTTSGILDLVNVFDVPCLNINHTPVGASPLGKQALFIPKKVKLISSGRDAKFKDLLCELPKMEIPVLWNGPQFAEKGYRYEDNTADEILAATVEMLERMNGVFRETDDDRRLQERYRQLFPAGHWAAQCLNPIGRDFLRNNQDYFFGGGV